MSPSILFFLIAILLCFSGCASHQNGTPDVTIRVTSKHPVVRRSQPFDITFSAYNRSKRTIRFHDLVLGSTIMGVGEWGIWHESRPMDASCGGGVVTYTQHAFCLAPGQTLTRTETFDASDCDPISPLGKYRVGYIANNVSANREIKIESIPTSIILRK